MDFPFQSVIAKQRLYELSEQQNYVPAFMNFSAQTNSFRTQEIIENKLEKKRKNILGKLSTSKLQKDQFSLLFLILGCPSTQIIPFLPLLPPRTLTPIILFMPRRTQGQESGDPGGRSKHAQTGAIRSPAAHRAAQAVPGL